VHLFREKMLEISTVLLAPSLYHLGNCTYFGLYFAIVIDVICA